MTKGVEEDETRLLTPGSLFRVISIFGDFVGGKRAEPVKAENNELKWKDNKFLLQVIYSKSIWEVI